MQFCQSNRTRSYSGGNPSGLATCIKVLLLPPPKHTYTNEGHAQIKKKRIVALNTWLARSHHSDGGHFLYSHMFSPRLAVLVSLSVSDSKRRGGHSLSQNKPAWQQKHRGLPVALANRMLVEGLLEGMSIDGAPVFEAGAHGLKL